MHEGRAHVSENLAVSESPLEGVNVQTGELDPEHGPEVQDTKLSPESGSAVNVTGTPAVT